MNSHIYELMNMKSAFICRFIVNLLIAANALISLLLFADSFDPHVGEMRDFRFGCDGCGWSYGSKYIYSIISMAHAAVFVMAVWLGWRNRHRFLPALACLIVIPIVVFIFDYLLIIKPFWLE